MEKKHEKSIAKLQAEILKYRKKMEALTYGDS